MTNSERERPVSKLGPVLVTVFVLLSFAVAMVLALTHTIPAGSETALNMLLGSLGAMANWVVHYWIGSSSGSAQKTQLLYDSVPAPGKNDPP